MKVKELIEQLKKFEEDADILVFGGWDQDFQDMYSDVFQITQKINPFSNSLEVYINYMPN